MSKMYQNKHNLSIFDFQKEKFFIACTLNILIRLWDNGGNMLKLLIYMDTRSPSIVYLSSSSLGFRRFTSSPVITTAT